MSKPIGLVYILFVVALLADLLLSNVEGSLSKVPLLSPYLGAIVVFLLYKGKSEFLYDSDGEVLNFTAKDSNLAFLGRNYHMVHTEFPKRKLAKYKIASLPLKKSLTLYIQSKEGYSKRQNIPVSYLSSKYLKQVTAELDEVLAKNTTK